MKKLGENIRIIREIKGFTQEGLANLIGCSQKQISRLENGQTPIKEKCLSRIAQALDTSIDKIENFDISSFLK